MSPVVAYPAGTPTRPRPTDADPAATWPRPTATRLAVARTQTPAPPPRPAVPRPLPAPSGLAGPSGHPATWPEWPGAAAGRWAHSDRRLRIRVSLQSWSCPDAPQ